MVDIIVPVYNVEKYLEPCLQSILQQATTVPLRVICVNDGSTDASPQILKTFRKRDSRITIINRENGGLSAARNTGLEHVTAPYVYFVDSDDLIRENCIEQLFRAIRQHDTDFVICGHQCFYSYGHIEENQCFDFSGWQPACLSTPEEKSRVFTYCFVWSKLLKTEFIRKHKLRFAEGLCFEDNLFHFQCLCLASRIALITDKLYLYRIRNGSIVKQRGKHYLDMIEILDRSKSFLKEHRFFHLYDSVFLAFKLNVSFWHFQYIKNKYREQCRQLIIKSLDCEERQFLSTNSNALSADAARFYSELLDGQWNWLKSLRWKTKSNLKNLIRPFYMKVYPKALRKPFNRNTPPAVS
ncbi:MAG: glycosyltransferase [Victivallaceae bacterium]|nr:glycosyltransferase [Victivallaceae bacterium]